MFLRILLFLFALTCLCHAEEKERSAAEWSKELAAGFAKHSGYIARYEGKSKDNRLKATLATDREGQSLIGLTFIAGEQQQETRMWAKDDALHVDAGAPGGRHIGKNLRESLAPHERRLKELSLLPGEEAVTLTLEPRLGLTDTDLVAILQATVASVPTWKESVAGATRVEAGPEEVVFHMGKDGFVAISRKSGMLARQTVNGTDGSKRELWLVGLELNPDDAALAKASDGWSSEGAQPMDITAVFANQHAIVFEKMIRQVDQGEVPHERMKEVLQAKADFLRSWFRRVVSPVKEEQKTTWKEYIDHTRQEISEKLKAEGKGSGDKEQLTTSEAKAAIRDSLARGRMEDQAKLLPLLMGKNYGEWSKPSTDAGKAAVKTLEEAVLFALAAAEVEMRMEEVK